MIVVCRENISDVRTLVIPENPEQIMSNENLVWFLGGETLGPDLVRYSLRPGHRYCVYGIVIDWGCIRYLVQDEDGLPCFAPRDLFEIEQPDLPCDWKCTEYVCREGSLMLFAYDPISRSYAAFRDLVNTCPDAVQAFLNYRASMSV